MTEEWYPRECPSCTREAARACEDPVYPARGYGQDHILAARRRYRG